MISRAAIESHQLFSEVPRANGCQLTPSEILKRRNQSPYADIVAESIAQGAETMQVSIEGMKPATPRAGLGGAPKGNENVELAQRAQETYLVKAPKK